VSQQEEENNVPPGKQRVTLQLPAELIERARDTVYWTPGLTLNRLAEIAFLNTLDCMEALRGSAFPPRGGSLKVGRQVR
jgi:hypothetical protein